MSTESQRGYACSRRFCNEILIVSYNNMTKYSTVIVDSKQDSPDAFDNLSLVLQHRSKFKKGCSDLLSGDSA